MVRTCLIGTGAQPELNQSWVLSWLRTPDSTDRTDSTGSSTTVGSTALQSLITGHSPPLKSYTTDRTLHSLQSSVFTRYRYWAIISSFVRSLTSKVCFPFETRQTAQTQSVSRLRPTFRLRLTEESLKWRSFVTPMRFSVIVGLIGSYGHNTDLNEVWGHDRRPQLWHRTHRTHHWSSEAVSLFTVVSVSPQVLREHHESSADKNICH